ncbi:MAG TPA: hypothetical protein VKR82_10135 [Candidatus Acidoferrales bacterium]|nr:hypothetical protein [Candidatus Acidoferrales bacterium]
MNTDSDQPAHFRGEGHAVGTTTGPRPKRGRTKRRWLYSAVLLLALASFFAIFPNYIVATAWHLWHDHSVLLGQLEIPVPSSWWTVTPDSGVIITRMPPRFEKNDTAEIVIAPLKSRAKVPIDLERWKSLMTAETVGDNYTFKSELPMRVGNTLIPCLEFDARREKDWVQVSCIIPSQNAYMEFTGSTRYVSAFEAIAAGIKGIP